MGNESVEAAPETAIIGAGFEESTLAIFERDFAPALAEKLAFYKQVRLFTDAVKVTDPDSLAAADKWNKEFLREAAELEKVRAAGPGALNRLGRKMGARFKPLFDEIEAGSSNLKKEIGGYVLAEKAKQEAEYQAAVAAHVAGDHEAAQTALAIASGANTSAPKGNTVKPVWVVERYALELMVLSTPTHPGLVPDEKAINAYLRALPPGEEPNLPGVICKQEASVITRKGQE